MDETNETKITKETISFDKKHAEEAIIDLSRQGHGRIVRVCGPVVTATGIDGDKVSMYDIVNVGPLGLIGEVIQIREQSIIIQVYEDTTGLKPGDPVEGTGKPLSVMLGPGLLGSIYDGIQRPLPELERMTGSFIGRGASAPSLPPTKKWDFTPTAKAGDKVRQGMIIGTVPEGKFLHKILVGAGMAGKIRSINAGAFTVHEPVGTLEDGQQLFLASAWPVRAARPLLKKLPLKIPLITGRRIIDTLFPLAKGGTASIPGPFGAGKTVNQQQLAKYCDADVIVYIGCGERGNEMTEILTEFPELQDPRSGEPLMNRTVLIANTSNMPVAAREASIYTGITIAEYFRDMGYDVALMADSTSRWAEAMREISSRLEEMPGEEGYPAYLSSRLSEFYERAGRAITLASTSQDAVKGSISIIGAVSPAGGDFSEPVTQATLRVTKAFWALDAKLAQRRHFPSINWLQSYSLYHDALDVWFVENVAQDWRELIKDLNATLAEEERLMEIVQLVGSDALPEREQLTLEISRIIREGFLQQDSFSETDANCSLRKSYLMMKAIVEFKTLSLHVLAGGVQLPQIMALSVRERLMGMKYEKDAEEYLKRLITDIQQGFANLFSKKR